MMQWALCGAMALLCLVGRVVSGEQWMSIAFHVYIAAAIICGAIHSNR